ncbi:MAG: pilus assembly protein PilM [Candidatus Omnitrophota bacterium]|nr:pilus assembly protein PilM [Candidatus Omnitrophota bacterium]
MARFNASSIALDIGTHFIKLVELKKEKAGIVLTKIGIKEIPRDLKIDRDKITVQLISQLMSENRVKPGPVNISVSGQSVFVRFVKLLQVKEDKLKQTMRFEAQNQIPFGLNEVMWDWALLDKDKNTASRKAVIVAIKKNIAEDMVSKLNAVKLSVRLIDVAPVSVYNCMAFNEDYNPENLGAVLDIGAKSTNFIIFNKGNIWIRSFPIAGERIEEAKEQGIEELLAEAERSLEYYFVQQGEDAPKERKLGQLFMTGGGSFMGDIESALSSRLGVKPQAMDPFRKLRISKDVFQKAQQEGMKNQFATVVGAALRGMTGLNIEVNFLKEAISGKRLSFEKRLYAGLSMAAGAMILISFSIFMRQEYYIKKIKLDKVEDMIGTYRTYEPKIKKIREEEGILTGKMDTIYQLASSRAVWLGIFESISEMLPKDVWITDLSGVISIEKSSLGRMDMNGKALSYQSVNSFVSSLKALPGFSDVRPVSSSVENDKDTGEEIVKFSITMDVVL